MASFDPEVALNYACSIARARRVGCADHEAAAREIADRLRRFGYSVEPQPFTFSSAPSNFLLLEILIGLLLILSIVAMDWLAASIGFVPAILIGLLIVLAAPINWIVQTASIERAGRSSLPGKKYRSANLVARWPDAPDVARPQLYLVAHYDSKSQRLPLAVRMALFAITIGGGLLVAVLTLFQVSAALITLIGALAFIAGLPLLFLDAGNDSPGAIDNASGVGLVLQLAEYLSRRSDLRDKLQWTILMTSAEELNVMGSAAFVQQHDSKLRQAAARGGLYILNFDGIGVDGDLRWVGNSRSKLSTLLVQTCRELQLPLKRFNLVGALYDHIPFARQGFEAVTLVAVGRASLAIHTPRDTIDKLHVRGFEQSGRAAVGLIEKLAQQGA